jgi:hypothetical protein
MATVAEELVKTLRDAGVKRIYGVVGDSLNPIVDAIRRTEGIEWFHVRHEETAAFAAAAEAQLTGRLAVCAGSCGPGNLHLINGLYDAHRSGAPVLAITSHVPSEQIGTGYFQETHPDRLFVECSHFSELASQPAQMPRLLDIAMQIAVGRGGVSVLTIPGDVAAQPAVHPSHAPLRLAQPSPALRVSAVVGPPGIPACPTRSSPAAGSVSTLIATILRRPGTAVSLTGRASVDATHPSPQRSPDEHSRRHHRRPQPRRPPAGIRTAGSTAADEPVDQPGHRVQ